MKWLLTLLFVLIGVLGCSQAPEDARIPADVTKRSPAFIEAMEALNEQDRVLLNRYLLRQKLSAAYASGALTKAKRIKDALKEQHAYEKMHPHDPTGKITYLKAINSIGTQSGHLLFAELLRVVQVEENPNQVALQLVLSNGFDKPVSSVQATVRLTSVVDEKQHADIALDEQFVTPIPVEGSVKVKKRTDIAPIAIMKAIKDKSLVSTALVSAQVTLSDGEQVSW